MPWTYRLMWIATLAIAATHQSQLGQDFEIYASQEFGLVELGDAHSRASALMPSAGDNAIDRNTQAQARLVVREAVWRKERRRNLAIAKTLKAGGVDIKMIAQATGLEEEEVENDEDEKAARQGNESSAH